MSLPIPSGGPLAGDAPFVVIHAPDQIAHPHLNVWLPRGQLGKNEDGNLIVAPNLPQTFSGVAAPTANIETRDDGQTAQIFSLLSVELRRTRARRPRRRPHQL